MAIGLSSWVAGATIRWPGKQREEKNQTSGLECIRYESIQGKISSRQLDLPTWSSGKRSTQRYKFRSCRDTDGI